MNTIVSRHYNGDSGVIAVNNVKRQWIMLILTRRLTETLVTGDSVTLTDLEIKGSRSELA